MENVRPPKISVLMPVYNGAKYLREAIESILSQTFTDFEFLIINDGSTDNSVAIIESYQDPRIRLVHNEKNLQLIKTLNKGLELARGEYVARMDCDDISLPKRLEKQVVFMDTHPEVGVCGTWIETFDDQNRNGSAWESPVESDDIRIYLLFNSAMAHPSVCMRLSLLKQFNLKYSEEDLYAEDYGLWIRCMQCFVMHNIPEVLLKYRLNPTGITRIRRDDQIKTALEIRKRVIRMFGLEATEDELVLHNDIAENQNDIELKKLIHVKVWMQKLCDTNAKNKYFAEPKFQDFLHEKWLCIWRAQKELSLDKAKLFCRCPGFLKKKISFKIKMEFTLKCLRRQLFKKRYARRVNF